MRAAIMTNAFRESNLIGDCIDQFKGFDLDHFVLWAPKSWNSDRNNDIETAEIAEEHGGIVIPTGRITHKRLKAHEQFNIGLKILQEKDYEWALVVDADERYSDAGIEELLSDLEETTPFEIAVRSNNWDVYWKTDYKIVPPQTDYPLVAIRPSARFYNIRQPYISDAVSVKWTNSYMAHFSYSRTDADMWKKVQTFQAASEFSPEDWYRNVWQEWTPDMRGLHPVNPMQFEQAIYSPVSKGIRKVSSGN